MSAAANVPDPVTQPEPAPAGEDEPSRFRRVLNLVRKLIDYGKELATTLQRPSATADLATVTLPFGTRDIGLILARITRGLLLATALEARVEALAAKPDVPPKPSREPVRRPRRAAPATRSSDDAADPRLARLPTAEQIAAEVRRRPIGAVIADICRDLGIRPCHPLWREVHFLIIQHGGSAVRLFMDLLRRSLPVAGLGPPAMVAVSPPLPALAATGPP
jgi:hypothetical protein